MSLVNLCTRWYLTTDIGCVVTGKIEVALFSLKCLGYPAQLWHLGLIYLALMEEKLQIDLVYVGTVNVRDFEFSMY